MRRWWQVVVTAGLVAWCGVPAAAAQDLLARAVELQHAGRLDSALTVIEAAVLAEPNRAELQFRLGDIAGERASRGSRLSALGLARKSKRGFARAVELEPENPRYLESLAQFLSQAPAFAGGDRDSALALAEHLRRIDETRGTFLTVDVLRRGNDRQKLRADSVVDAFGRTHAGERVAQIRISGYYANSNRPERALAIHERLLGADSNDVVARYGVARNLVVLRRDPARAVGYMHRVLARPAPPPDGPTYQPAAAWWRMGQAFTQLAQTDSARIVFERSLAIDPQFRPARSSLDSLRP
jgi:tetratricopeptide (TPR) repeat protein